jgi:hypothetical protein
VLDLLDGQRELYKPLELQAFINKSMSFARTDVVDMSPVEIIDSLSFCVDDEQRRQMLSSTLDHLRSKRKDIKQWQPKELASLVKEVAEFDAKELSSFFNYAEAALDLKFFEITPSNFYSYADMFCSFASNGLISSRSTFYRRFLIAMKEVLYPSRKSKSDAAKTGQINQTQLIKITWALLLTEDPTAYTPFSLKLI